MQVPRDDRVRSYQAGRRRGVEGGSCLRADERGRSCCLACFNSFAQNIFCQPPGARARVALTGLTVAEYFRDEEGQDVLLFIDNIFRFTQVRPSLTLPLRDPNAVPQACSEVSALLGRIPSAVGYQPTLATDLGALQERITTTKNGSITSVQAIYVPADDLTDPGKSFHLFTNIYAMSINH